MMIGLVVVSHGQLAKALVAATEHVVGAQNNLRALCVGADDDIERRRADIQAAIEAVDTGSGVVVVTDMFGGTPANLAISLMERGRVEVLAGANLPMLIKLVETRGSGTLDETAEAALDAGRKYINMASRVLRGDGA